MFLFSGVVTVYERARVTNNDQIPVDSVNTAAISSSFASFHVKIGFRAMHCITSCDAIKFRSAVGASLWNPTCTERWRVNSREKP